MSRKISFSPMPLAMAGLVSALFATANLAPIAVSAAQPPIAAAKQAGVRQFTLRTGLAAGKMVFLDAQGQANPTLRANVGDTVEIVISSGEGAQHDIAFPQLNVASAKFDATTGATKVRFKVTKAGTFEYICTIAGHRQIGMEGVLEVSGPKGAPDAAAPAPVVSTHAGHAPPTAKAATQQKLAPAAADAVSIAMDPTAVPKPIGARAPQVVKYHIETVELAGKLDDGTTFTYWTFDKKVPGPMLRVRTGDTVELTLANNKSSKAIHSIDLHSVTGGHGGGEHTQVGPGQSKTIRFKALKPGLYVYHCATHSVPHHISAGMYGLILVEPEEGLAPVDREFYVMQGDLYTSHPAGTKGHQEFNHERAADELPTYYFFNGAVGALTKEHKMTAKVGETVRVYFGVGGPNKVSSFHVIGEIFDKVYSEGSVSGVNKDVQTTLVAPGGATIVEFKVEYPGKYMLVDHALSRVGKGLVGTLEVTGPADSSIYQPMGSDADAHAH